MDIGVDPAVRAGADPLGRARVYAPFPIVGGSSISHYDTVARRNLLMEPAINADLTHNVKAPYDLTFEFLRDIGWTFPDADADGVVDDEDCNPNSNRAPTIVIGGIDSGVENHLFPTGMHQLRSHRHPGGGLDQSRQLRVWYRGPDQRMEG